MKFLKYELRELLEKEAAIAWEDVFPLLELLPIEELRNLVKEPERCLKMVEHNERTKHRKKFRGNPSEALTVEDLNSMMMFLQKLPYDELHLLIEYTQMLLDYLTLPAAAPWREVVLQQVRIQARDPAFHRNIDRLRQ